MEGTGGWPPLIHRYHVGLENEVEQGKGTGQSVLGFATPLHGQHTCLTPHLLDLFYLFPVTLEVTSRKILFSK